MRHSLAEQQRSADARGRRSGRGSGSDRPAAVVLRAAAALLVLSLGAGCPRAREADPRLLARLTIACEPQDALVFIDDHHVGTVERLGGRPLTLRPGTRRVEVRREGYFAYYRDLVLSRGQRVRLVVNLRKEPF